MTERCAEIHRMLSEYLMDDLPAARRRKVEQHLTECPECARELSSLRKTLGLVELIDDRGPSPELLARGMTRLYERLGLAGDQTSAKEAAPPDARMRVSFGEALFRTICGTQRRVALVAAAVVLVLLAGWIGMRHFGREPYISEFAWYVDHHRTASEMASIRTRFLVPEERRRPIQYAGWTEVWLPDLWKEWELPSVPYMQADDLLPLEAVMGTLDFRPIAPSRVSTYILAGVRIANGDRKSLQLVYTDGYGVVSVFERPEERGATVSVKRETREGYGCELWRAEGVIIAVIGSATTERVFRRSERFVS